jgi:hypothetical protein
MQKRIIFLLILNVGIILVSLGVISHLSVNASIERSIENRRMLANIIGRYIDYVIESNVKRLYDISLSGKVDLEDNDWDPERKALKNTRSSRAGSSCWTAPVEPSFPTRIGRRRASRPSASPTRGRRSPSSSRSYPTSTPSRRPRDRSSWPSFP